MGLNTVKYLGIRAGFLACLSICLNVFSEEKDFSNVPVPTSSAPAPTPSPTTSTAVSSEEDDKKFVAAPSIELPLSTKIWRTQCSHLEESADKNTLLLAIQDSRLSFSTVVGDKDFVKFRTILKEACKDKEKKIDLRYDEESQKLVMLRFSK